jgi:hypothetical protein
MSDDKPTLWQLDISHYSEKPSGSGRRGDAYLSLSRRSALWGWLPRRPRCRACR